MTCPMAPTSLAGTQFRRSEAARLKVRQKCRKVATAVSAWLVLWVSSSHTLHCLRRLSVFSIPCLPLGWIANSNVLRSSKTQVASGEFSSIMVLVGSGLGTRFTAPFTVQPLSDRVALCSHMQLPWFSFFCTPSRLQHLKPLIPSAGVEPI